MLWYPAKQKFTVITQPITKLTADHLSVFTEHVEVLCALLAVVRDVFGEHFQQVDDHLVEWFVDNGHSALLQEGRHEHLQDVGKSRADFFRRTLQQIRPETWHGLKIMSYTQGQFCGYLY